MSSTLSYRKDTTMSRFATWHVGRSCLCFRFSAVFFLPWAVSGFSYLLRRSYSRAAADRRHASPRCCTCVCATVAFEQGMRFPLISATAAFFLSNPIKGRGNKRARLLPHRPYPSRCLLGDLLSNLVLLWVRVAFCCTLPYLGGDLTIEERGARGKKV